MQKDLRIKICLMAYAFAGLFLVRCGNSSIVLQDGSLRSLIGRTEKTDQDLVKATNFCIRDILEEVSNELKVQPGGTENQTSEFLASWKDEFDHVLVAQAEKSAGDYNLVILDFGGKGSDTMLDPEKMNTPPHLIGTVSGRQIGFYLKDGLPRLHFRTRQSDEYTDLGEKIPHSPDKPVVARDISLWIPQTHGEAVPLRNTGTGQASSITINTIKYVQCLEREVTR